MNNPLPDYSDLSWARAQAIAARMDAQDYFDLAITYGSYNEGACFTIARQYHERALSKCAQLADHNMRIRALENLLGSSHE